MYTSAASFLRDASHNRLLAVPAALYAVNNYLKFAMQVRVGAWCTCRRRALPRRPGRRGYHPGPPASARGATAHRRQTSPPLCRPVNQPAPPPGCAAAHCPCSLFCPCSWRPQLYFKPTTAKMLSNLKILVIAVLMRSVLRRRFSVVQARAQGRGGRGERARRGDSHQDGAAQWGAADAPVGGDAVEGGGPWPAAPLERLGRRPLPLPCPRPPARPQWEALYLLVAGITVNQLNYCSK